MSHVRVVSVGDNRNATRLARAMYAAVDDVLPDADPEVAPALAAAFLRHNIGEGLRMTAGVRTAAEVMAYEPDPVDELRYLCELVDEGYCSPLCLFGMEEGPCQCRCDGVHHSAARP